MFKASQWLILYIRTKGLGVGVDKVSSLATGRKTRLDALALLLIWMIALQIPPDASNRRRSDTLVVSDMLSPLVWLRKLKRSQLREE